MALVVLFAAFAVLGLMVTILDFGAKMNSAAPSVYRSDAGGWGMIVFVVCGLISLAAFAAFRT